MDSHKAKLKELLNLLITGREYGVIFLANWENGLYLRAAAGELLEEPWEGNGTGKTEPEEFREMLEFIGTMSLEKVWNKLEHGRSYQRFFSHSRTGRVWRITWQLLAEGEPWICILAREITDMFSKDTLTGLLNYKAFIHKMGGVLQERPKERFAVLFFDILNFKAFNGMFGFEMGDTSLQNIAKKIQESFLEPVLCARIEADHFMALIRQERLDERKLGELLRYVFHVQEAHYCFYGRCGIYLVDGSAANVSDMCDCARIACNSIGRESAKPYAFYNSAMSQEKLNQGLIQFNFEHSVQNGEFQIYYQPIFDARTERMVSAEALVRWDLPGYGLISPNSFIPTLESSGHISKLDIYISQQVFKFQKERMDAGRRTVPISINISRVDVHDMECIQYIRDSLHRDPEVMGRLRMEITESSYWDISKQGRNYLNLLREDGVKILIDDFGNGKSSFSAIRDFEFDFIKIDMGFIRKIGVSRRNDVICRAIIDMAHAIGVQVIAEGVETQAQVEFLRESGCDCIQGYYYSKPLCQGEFDRLLDGAV